MDSSSPFPPHLSASLSSLARSSSRASCRSAMRRMAVPRSACSPCRAAAASANCCSCRTTLHQFPTHHLQTHRVMHALSYVMSKQCWSNTPAVGCLTASLTSTPQWEETDSNEQTVTSSGQNIRRNQKLLCRKMSVSPE